ncbi:MAG: NAD-dependent epimerase/dehydratase family protein [Microcoleaceae cyanobacterium]
MEEPQYTLPSGSRVLVTGGTGFTGSALLKKLIDQGVNITAIARPTSNLEPFSRMPIEWLRGHVFDENLINQAMKNVNYVFHMATPFREAKSPDSVYHNVHVLSTQHLAKAALNQPDFRRFVHVSTIGVHSHVANPPGDENSPMEPGDIYQSTKLEGERWIREFAEQSGLPVTVVRPTGIYGPGEKRLLKIYKWVAKQRVPVIGNGSNLLHFIHVEDLTNFLLLAATHPTAVGEAFICGSHQAITFKQMVELVASYYRVKPKLMQFPAAPIFALGDMLEFICRPFGIEPPIYRRRLAFYTKDRSFDISKMQDLLGFTPVYSNQDGLQELAQWYLEQGWITVQKPIPDPVI